MRPYWMPVSVSYSFWEIGPIPPSPTWTSSFSRQKAPTGLMTAAVPEPKASLMWPLRAVSMTSSMEIRRSCTS